MVIALPDPMATRLTLKRALSLAPDLDITVRAHINDVLWQSSATSSSTAIQQVKSGLNQAIAYW